MVKPGLEGISGLLINVSPRKGWRGYSQLKSVENATQNQEKENSEQVSTLGRCPLHFGEKLKTHLKYMPLLQPIFLRCVPG